MVSIGKGPWERRHGRKRRDEEKSAAQEANCNTMEELHVHLSHIGVPTIRDMMAKVMISGVMLHPDHTEMGQCIACKYGKAARKPIGTICEPNHTVAVTILFLGSTLFLISSFHTTSPFLGSLSYAYHYYLLILGPLTFTVRAL